MLLMIRKNYFQLTFYFMTNATSYLVFYLGHQKISDGYLKSLQKVFLLISAEVGCTTKTIERRNIS